MSDVLARYIEGLRASVFEGRILLRKHADERAGKRKIAYSSIIDVVSTGDIVEFYPDAEPMPACLLMKQTENGEPLYVVCGFDGDYCYIITVHWLDPAKWDNPWTRRKS